MLSQNKTNKKHGYPTQILIMHTYNPASLVVWIDHSSNIRDRCSYILIFRFSLESQTPVFKWMKDQETQQEWSRSLQVSQLKIILGKMSEEYSTQTTPFRKSTHDSFLKLVSWFSLYITWVENKLNFHSCGKISVWPLENICNSSS